MLTFFLLANGSIKGEFTFSGKCSIENSMYVYHIATEFSNIPTFYGVYTGMCIRHDQYTLYLT